MDRFGYSPRVASRVGIFFHYPAPAPYRKRWDPKQPPAGGDRKPILRTSARARRSIQYENKWSEGSAERFRRLAKWRPRSDGRSPRAI
jgi:hypothetical protein